MKLLKVFFIILFFSNILFADVKINAPMTFVENEPYIFTIKATGSDITFPKIDKISNQKVQTISTSKSINIINSVMTKSLIRKYRLFPKEDFVIPSFTFEVDGKSEKTKELIVKKQKANKSNLSYADFEIIASKKDVYVGEAFKVKLKFKYLSSLDINNLSISNANFKNFWFKQLKDNKQYQDGDFVVNELTYLMFAQKYGKLKIEPFRINMSIVNPSSDPFSNFGFMQQNAQVKKIYSNALIINAKALPSNLNLIGDFNIKASVDKKIINQGDSITYKIKIDGYGNIDDIKDIKLDIKNAQVFENKPKITTKIVDSKYYGEYEKTFSIIPLNSINIGSIKLKYFDDKTKQIVEKQSDSFFIKVNEVKKEQKKLYVPKKLDENKKVVIKEVKTFSFKENILSFILGILFTCIVFYLYKLILKNKENSKKDSNIISKIKKSNSKEELIRVLAVYIKKDRQLDKLIFKLEDENLNLKTVKKDIINLIKQLEKGKK
ncbi:hypothetical protein CPU12_05140 [Malaciobacter molluscorum LMG 25693]|uniref:Aerotolerance protein BatD n=1 Tax=Malaciobacter molluscorum LMG 25693 TaxID=870501 RepID=A0A2G1DIT8_9BACT|nr:BatD family protein [Malaciobacter molluscorum]AXX93121.1 putative aerotolerance protein BatD [Malaciobacter molluscorum LMG 25693]PHO18381.1 hypothetical protein CPU12_05140 [Malaciobacter molluscorum LMG 25693]